MPAKRKKPSTRKKAPRRKPAPKKKKAPKRKPAAKKKKAAPKKKKAPKRKPAAKKKKAGAAPSWTELQPAVSVPVDTAVYPIEVIYGAAYVFLDRAYVHLTGQGPGKVSVSLMGKDRLDGEGLLALGGEFANELVNQALRITLDESGRKLREYIVAKAHFFQDGGAQGVQKLLDSTMQEAFDEDPLDIAVPWEEKYGDGGKGEG
jgi:His-Xaa-Ser system protein HxsD